MGIPSPLCYSHEVQHVKGEVDVLAEFLLGCSGRLLKQLVRRLCEQKSVIDNCCEGSQSSLWRHVRHRPFMWRHVFIYGSAFAKQIFWSPERGTTIHMIESTQSVRMRPMESSHVLSEWRISDHATTSLLLTCPQTPSVSEIKQFHFVNGYHNPAHYLNKPVQQRRGISIEA